MNDYMLTTYDNPYNPFTEFDQWFKEDLRLGHDCCGMLDRFASTSNIVSDAINDANILLAMDEIVDMDPTLYRKVLPTDFKEQTQEDTQ